MKIPFKNITHAPKEFRLNRDNIEFFGDLSLKKANIIKLNGTISADLSTACDRCGDDTTLCIDESVEFYISDGFFSGNDIDLDVVEIENSIIDMDEILTSELELIKSDYNYCDRCRDDSNES